jgi:AraC-like DNA-binding protein
MLTTYKTSDINCGNIMIADLHHFLQDEEKTPGRSAETHLVKGVLLCFCRRGTASIRINYATYQLTPDSILAILPTHIFSLETQPDDGIIEAVIYSDEYWSAIAQSIDYQLIKVVERNPLTHLPAERKAELEQLLEIIRRHNTAVERVAVRGTAYALLMLLVSGLESIHTDDPRPAGRKEELTHDFFDLLAQHHETERRVGFYASKLCVTPKYLSTVVKEVTRSSITEWINHVTILNVKRRLLTSSDSVQQIAEELNFQTSSTLVRYFHHLTGTTPMKFRSEHALG